MTYFFFFNIPILTVFDMELQVLIELMSYQQKPHSVKIPAWRQWKRAVGFSELELIIENR